MAKEKEKKLKEKEEIKEEAKKEKPVKEKKVEKEENEVIIEEEIKEDYKEDELLNLEKQLDELNNKYLYTLAEMKDLHKSYEQENKRNIKYVTYDFMYELLGVYDIFSMVLENKKIPDQVKAYFKGFELVFAKLKQFFEDHKVSEILVKEHEAFDHNYHNAVDTVMTNKKGLDGLIEEVLQQGFKFEDRILRPVSVKVYKYKEDKKSTLEQEEAVAPNDEVIEEETKGE